MAEVSSGVATPRSRMSQRPHLLIVDDDREIRGLLAQYLEKHDFRTTAVADGKEMRRVMERSHVDLLVLDLMLPGEDGLTLCRELRSRSQVPIIMLTARGEDVDRIVGLELGADDYLPKPFNPRELLGRIKAILRRVEQRGEDALLTGRDIVLRRDSHDVTVGGAAIELTSKEFDLLACFLEHPGIVLSREKLLDLVWGMTYPGGTRTVDVHVAQLRRKLGDPDSIRTVRGAGYKLTAA